MGKRDAVLFRAERLAAGLRSYRSPTVCPNCLAYFVYGCDSEDGATSLHSNIVFLLYNCHDFWEALAMFLFRDWTSGMRQGLHERLRLNRERCTLCPADRLWGACACNYLRHVFDSCCRALYLCLSKSLSRKDKRYWDTRTRWPDSLDQLFPYGPRAAATILIQLLGTVDYAHHLFAVVLANDRSRLMPIISEDANRTAILSCVLADMKSMTTSLRKRLTRPISVDQCGRLDFGPKGSIPHLLLTVCFPYDGAPLDTAYLRGYHRKLSDELNSLIHLGDQCGMDTGRYLRLAATLWNTLPPHLKGERPSFVIPEDGKAALIFRDPYRHLHDALFLLLQKQCRGRDCPPPAADKRPAPLRKCGGCHITQYCSQQCQKADWRCQRAPHKEICPVLQQLFEFASLDMTEEEFSAACRENEFPLARVDRLIKWASGDPTCYALGAPDDADEIIFSPGCSD